MCAACASGPETASRAEPQGGAGACPARSAGPERLPGTEPDHLRLEYWLGRYSAEELDRELLSVDDIARYQHAVGRAGNVPYAQRDLATVPKRSELQHEVKHRLAFVRARVRDGRYVDRDGRQLTGAALEPLEADLPEVTPELRVALALVPLRCGPIPMPLFERPADGATGDTAPAPYDRNACSAARPQEVVQLLARWPNGMWLARTRYAFGFIDAGDAPLSPVLPAALHARFVHGARARAPRALQLRSRDGHAIELPEHATVPLLSDGRVLVASATGFHELSAPEVVETARPLTRRELLRTAFEYLDSPYGFGDANGGRDCSRLQLDLFESFGIGLPRHSAAQAQAGSYRLDVASASTAEKLELIAAAAQSGVVLLAFPGHIMLHLGKNDAGTDMVLHALGEFAAPCDGGGETVFDVQRTVVSDLSLGKGSSRKSLLERVTTLVVFGTPPPALVARARTHALPPPAVPGEGEACKDSASARIFVSPARPVAGRAVRFIATTSKPVQNPALWLYDARGELAGTTARHLGGPPFTVWRRIDTPAEGRVTALFMDGDTVLGCKRLSVRGGSVAPDDRPAPEGAPVWTPRWAWEEDTLNLWSAFVEQMFDDPPDDERTWTDLHTLLRDPERNLLHDHLGRDEDAQFDLVPDCADLPYALRAYFSWKLGLPFGYRQCSRGRSGVPPSCGPLQTNLMPREAPDDVAAFAAFVNRRVRSGVHSASGRTHPEDPETDIYPVALERSALAPGTVYADPYGHVLIVTKWFPQGRDPADYGILMAAEAQPDGTVGRRRFFRGSFLFDPSTKDAGAGFKQFRPLVYDRKAGTITALDNEALKKSTLYPRFSLQQYQGSKDDFYDQVDRLINPAPLDARVRLTSLLDALDEAARRRVLAVDNGEQYMTQNGGRPMSMPSGYEIFETQGPWEDFATPSRDMRLLIAIDSVVDLPAHVERAPDRYKLASGEEAKRAAAQIREELARELAARKFSYTKSDGRPHVLSLADVIARADALEVGYNPNDCVELRWGAPADSDEFASCKRRAPEEQRARMERYRAWFHERTRPARGTR